MKEDSLSFFEADWPAPARVRTLITTRLGGLSQSPYSSLNLATHVGDELNQVEKNRELLAKQICCGDGTSIQWLTQVHGTNIIRLDTTRLDTNNQENTQSGGSNFPEADGAKSAKKNCVCAVLTADCLPVLMCSRKGTEVAAIHAGWQGLAKGILSKSVKAFSCAAEDVLCYLGPAISSKFYEVGEDVLLAFQDAEKNRPYFESVSLSFEDRLHTSSKKYMADLYRLARSELRGVGCLDIYGGELCTYGDSDRFFSYRRDGVTGRMASLIWID